MKTQRKIKTAYLAIYHVQQCYGGPEEGGWWYFSGVRSGNYHAYDISTTEAEEKLYKLQGRVARMLDHHYDINKRELSSVLSEGQMRCELHRTTPPTHYPKSKPHYE